MANYLARVAANGAASQPAARPSLIAPPILPGRPPTPEPDQPGSSRFARALAQPVTPTSIAADPMHRLEAPTPRPAAATKRSEAVRPVEVSRERSVSPAQAIPTPQPARTEPSRVADPNVVHAPRIRPTVQEVEATPSRHFEFRPEPVSVVQLPRALGRANPVARGEAVAGVSPITGPAPTFSVANPAQAADPVLPPQAAATAKQPERPEPHGDRSTPVERRIVRVPQVGSGTAVVEMPVAGSSRREPKITIGQIDVQVINTPSATPQQPAPPPSTSNVTNVELERVRWRPL